MKTKLIVLALLFGIFVIYASPSMAEIKVYDADNQYLGILLAAGGGAYPVTPSVIIIEPSQKRFLHLYARIDSNGIPVGNLSVSGHVRLSHIGSLYYETSDCSGTIHTTPLIRGGLLYNGVFACPDCGTDGLYSIKYSDKKTITAKSVKKLVKWPAWEYNPCEQISEEHEFFPWTEAEPLPFNLPVSLPLRYEFTNESSVFDINGDGKTGLHEAIHTLQVVSGVKPE